MPVPVEASDIDDAYGVPVMAADMCAHLLDGTACMYAAVEIHDEMIADAIPAARLVPAVDVGHAHILALARSCAMHGDVIDFATHDVI